MIIFADLDDCRRTKKGADVLERLLEEAQAIVIEPEEARVLTQKRGWGFYGPISEPLRKLAVLGLRKALAIKKGRDCETMRLRAEAKAIELMLWASIKAEIPELTGVEGNLVLTEGWHVAAQKDILSELHLLLRAPFIDGPSSAVRK